MAAMAPVSPESNTNSSPVTESASSLDDCSLSRKEPQQYGLCHDMTEANPIPPSTTVSATALSKIQYASDDTTIMSVGTPTEFEAATDEDDTAKSSEVLEDEDTQTQHANESSLFSIMAAMSEEKNGDSCNTDTLNIDDNQRDNMIQASPTKTENSSVSVVRNAASPKKKRRRTAATTPASQVTTERQDQKHAAPCSSSDSRCVTNAVSFRWHWLRLLTAVSIDDLVPYQIILNLGAPSASSHQCSDSAGSNKQTSSNKQSSSATYSSTSRSNKHPPLIQQVNQPVLTEEGLSSGSPVSAKKHDLSDRSQEIHAKVECKEEAATAASSGIVSFSKASDEDNDEFLNPTVAIQTFADLHYMFVNLCKGAQKSAFLNAHFSATALLEQWTSTLFPMSSSSTGNKAELSTAPSSLVRGTNSLTCQTSMSAADILSAAPDVFCTSLYNIACETTDLVEEKPLKPQQQQQLQQSIDRIIPSSTLPPVKKNTVVSSQEVSSPTLIIKQQLPASLPTNIIVKPSNHTLSSAINANTVSAAVASAASLTNRRYQRDSSQHFKFEPLSPPHQLHNTKTPTLSNGELTSSFGSIKPTEFIALESSSSVSPTLTSGNETIINDPSITATVNGRDNNSNHPSLNNSLPCAASSSSLLHSINWESLNLVQLAFAKRIWYLTSSSSCFSNKVQPTVLVAAYFFSKSFLPPTKDDGLLNNLISGDSVYKPSPRGKKNNTIQGSGDATSVPAGHNKRKPTATTTAGRQRGGSRRKQRIQTTQGSEPMRHQNMYERHQEEEEDYFVHEGQKQQQDENIKQKESPHLKCQEKQHADVHEIFDLLKKEGPVHTVELENQPPSCTCNTEHALKNNDDNSNGVPLSKANAQRDPVANGLDTDHAIASQFFQPQPVPLDSKQIAPPLSDDVSSVFSLTPGNTSSFITDFSETHSQTFGILQSPLPEGKPSGRKKRSSPGPSEGRTRKASKILPSSHEGFPISTTNQLENYSLKLLNHAKEEMEEETTVVSSSLSFGTSSVIPSSTLSAIQ